MDKSDKNGQPVVVDDFAAEHEELTQLRRRQIRGAISRGTRQCERGEMTDGDEALAQVRGRIEIAKSG